MPVSAHYRPRPVFLELGSGFSSVVSAERFPRSILRYRNQDWAERVGLGDLTEEEWINHFCRFRPLPDNLGRGLALRYHGHQFHSYNADLGDGRGFLFAQLMDPIDGRLLELGTKGTGETPYSRDFDGRLSLKGAMREVLASEMLEALGVYTSKTLSVVETGERIYRVGEPRPLRSAVLVRLSHGHLRIGSFQLLAFYRDREGLNRLVNFALRHYLPEAVPGSEDRAPAALLNATTVRMAEMVAGWMVAGFAHGVLNTDNMSITGESFDYGPYRYLETYDPRLAPADFDEAGLYAFGRQPTEVLWNLKQLAYALSLLAPVDVLIPALKEFIPAFTRVLHRRFLQRLGVQPWDPVADATLVEAAYAFLARSSAPYDRFFFDWYGGTASRARAFSSPAAAFYRDQEFSAVEKALHNREPACPGRLNHPYFRRKHPCTLHHDEIGAILKAIDEDDDWGPFETKIQEIHEMRSALASEAGVAGHRPL